MSIIKSITLHNDDLEIQIWTKYTGQIPKQAELIAQLNAECTMELEVTSLRKLRDLIIEAIKEITEITEKQTGITG